MDDEEDAALLLLSDQLMDDEEDDENDIYEMIEDDEDDEIIVGTPQHQYFDDIDASFCEDEDLIGNGDEGLVQENPFEPVYPATAGLLFETDEPTTTAGKGIVLEAISLDNILPSGSRRRRS